VAPSLDCFVASLLAKTYRSTAALRHEARHLVLDLIVQFQADSEVDDDLGESDRLIIPAPGKSRAAIGP
jgi:hypothetical protein